MYKYVLVKKNTRIAAEKTCHIVTVTKSYRLTFCRFLLKKFRTIVVFFQIYNYL